MTEKTPEKDCAQRNPKIARIEIGARNLRTITVYPLSLGDQMKLPDTLNEGLPGYVGLADRPDIAVVSFAIEFIKKNIGQLLSLITDDGEKLLDEMTNDQAVDLAELVYSMNFERVAKKVQSLFGEKKEGESQSPLERLSPTFAPNTQDTESNIS